MSENTNEKIIQNLRNLYHELEEGSPQEYPDKKDSDDDKRKN
jgi:hypothetical protein